MQEFSKFYWFFVCLAKTLASAEINIIAAYPMPALLLQIGVCSACFGSRSGRSFEFRDRRDLIFEKCVPRQQLTVLRTEYLIATGYP